jgi:hypothetical protein
MGFDLSDYETVEDRLIRFWADHNEGSIVTTMMNYDGDSCVFRAEIRYDKLDEAITTSGYAHETRSERGVNLTSFVENCETSAIGRALANCGYATHGKRPSRTEMEKVNRHEPIVTQSTNERGDVTVRTQYPKIMGSTDLATSKQKGLIRALAAGRDLVARGMIEAMQEICQDPLLEMDNLTMPQASAVIGAWKVGG